MAACVADSLASADLGAHAQPKVAIAVIQAGTGVGKSAAYLAPAIALALQRNTRVLVSTATVALQEQLLHKDLPALAAAMDQPFAYALAKGRGRYVCLLKLQQLAGGGEADGLFDDEDTGAAGPPAVAGAQEQRQLWLAQLQSQLASGAWDGDRDTLAETPEPQAWSGVAADRHSCSARHCPHYAACSYYRARSALTQAQVIVANHDLVLASIGRKTLPELDNCLLVFDEGHHLPAVALDQFSSRMELSRLRWLERLPVSVAQVCKRLQLDLALDYASVSSQLRSALTALAQQVLQLLRTSGTPTGPGPQREQMLRFANGTLPTELQAPLTQIQAQAAGLATALQALGQELRALARDDAALSAQCAHSMVQLGALAPRLHALADTSALLLEHGEQPLAKWLSLHESQGYLDLSAHACPIVPGDLLRQFLWTQVRAAVITSASLTSCGSFDYFLHESGLQGKEQVRTLQVSSPFDYARQGTLTVVHTRADPKNVHAYTQEMLSLLLHALRQVPHGALVLFTSRLQMRAAVDALDAPLREQVLVQGSVSRTRLLAGHSARVEAGLPSIVFGLQSFGEGLDLPGRLCETVFIAKLPFAAPSQPVDEARAEWLRSLGRDPFTELVIPATGMRLLQWTGRAIRSEDDQAHIVCFDKRLQTQAYGRSILAGLPPYRLLRRDA